MKETIQSCKDLKMKELKQEELHEVFLLRNTRGSFIM